MKNLKLYKQYKNIPRFYDGSEPTSSNYNGRRLGYNYMTGQWNGSNAFANTGTNTTSADTSGFSATPGQDLSGDINQQKAANTSNTINLISNASEAAVTGATSLASIGGSSLVAPTFSFAANPAGNAASHLTTTITPSATSNVTSNFLSTSGNVLGAVGGLAGAAMGGIQFGQGLKSFGNVLGNGVLDKATSFGTEQIGNRTYKVNNGYDESQVNELGDKQISNAKLQTTLGGLGTGMGVGAAAGSIGALAGMGTGAAAGSVLPGLGTAIGAGIGLLAGGIASIFGGKSAKRKMEEAKRNYAIQQNVSNMQEEAVAGDQAAKDNYYGAYNGKTLGQNMNGDYVGRMATPQGLSYGKVEGLASPDEGMINMATGETQYMGDARQNVADPRHDTIPVGGEGFNENVSIPGHMTNLQDPYGRSFADIARPYFKANEMIKAASQQIQDSYQKQTQENKNHKHRNDATKEYMQKKYDQMYQQQSEQLNQQYQNNTQNIAEIAQQQDMQKQYLSQLQSQRYYNGKTPLRTFWNGWGKIGNFAKNDMLPWLKENGASIVNTLGSIWALNKEADIIKDKGNLTQLSVQNKYADKALRELDNLHYNPDAELMALTNADRQNLYNIRSASNLSAGQKAALANSAANQNRLSRYTITADAFNKNAGYRAAYANALMQAGEAQANRDYNAQQLYEQQRIAQNASYVTNQLNRYKNVMSQIGNITQNLSGQRYNNKLLDLYAKDVELKAQQSQNNGNTAAWAPIGYNSLNDGLAAINGYKTLLASYVQSAPQTNYRYPLSFQEGGVQTRYHLTDETNLNGKSDFIYND